MAYQRLGGECGFRGCSESLRGKPARTVYCSRECKDKEATARKGDAARKRREGRKCSECQGDIPPERSPKALTCSDECARLRRTAQMRDNRPPCVVKGCDGTAHSLTGKYAGLCPAHAYRKKKGQPLTPIVRKMPTGGVCSFDGCDRKVRAQGLCASHYTQKIQGKPLVPIKTSPTERSDWVPEGTRRETQQGYIRIKTSDGWKREHTWVMEQHIGRPLEKGEMVHHKNGIRSDNKLNNLQLCRRFQPPGQTVVDLVAHAKHILATYGSLVESGKVC